MLNVRLTDCTECPDILELIEEIDCRLTELSKRMYSNIIFMFNQPIPAEAIIDLLNYKRILQYKYVNPLYASDYTLKAIASRIKLLKFKN